MKMKRSFKIILVISLITNLCLVIIQVMGHFSQRDTWERNIKMKYETRTKLVNVSETKNKFLDSLYKKYPELKDKKYLFINIWDTGDGWSIKQLPMLDTLIEPLKENFGYILVNDEKPDYAKRVLKQDTGLTNHFVFMDRCEDFMYAINQELLMPRTRFNYPHVPMNIILDNKGKIIYHDILESFSGPRYPEDSLKDRKKVQQLNKVLSELK